MEIYNVYVFTLSYRLRRYTQYDIRKKEVDLSNMAFTASYHLTLVQVSRHRFSKLIFLNGI